MYKEYEIEKFLDELSSTKSMPGGGTASALTAANGVALALKVINLSFGKEKYMAYKELLSEAKEKLETFKNLFLNYMDEDAKNFEAMEEVYKLKKDTAEEKEKRKKLLEDACKICCKVPTEIVVNSMKCLKILKSLEGKSNVSAASDLKVGEEFLKAAILGAYENVLINLKYIEDESFKKNFIELTEKVLEFKKGENI